MPQVMDADRMSRALTRIAHEILERNRGTSDLALVGIRTRGVPLARRIAHALQRHQSRRCPDRRARHHAVPRRPDAPRRRPAAGRPPHRDPVLDRRQADPAGGRRALHRADDPLGARRADRLRAAALDPADRPRRPRPPRAADQGGLRRQEPADVAEAERPGAPAGNRRRGRSAPRRSAQPEGA